MERSGIFEITGIVEETEGVFPRRERIIRYFKKLCCIPIGTKKQLIGCPVLDSTFQLWSPKELCPEGCRDSR